MAKPLPTTLLTEPVNGYVVVTMCKDPQEGFERPGKMILKLTTEAIEKDPVVVPRMVMAVGEQNKHNLKPGDVVYVILKFCFGIFCDGGLYVLIHEDQILSMLPREKAIACGVEQPVEFKAPSRNQVEVARTMPALAKA